MRKRENFLQDSGLDYETYKQCVGISTRNRATNRKDSAIYEKVDDKKKTQVKKQAYIPPQFIQPAKPVLIQFTQFKDYVSQLKPLIRDEPQQYMDIELLHAIHRQVVAKGGVVEVSSINGFSLIVKTFIIASEPSKIYHEINFQFIQKVRQLLFTIQFIHRNKAEVKIYGLGLVNFVGKEQLRQHVKDKVWGLKYFNYDLTLFQQGADGIDVDKSIFNLDYMCNHYSKQKIDIRIQNPLDYGFKPSKLKNKKYQMTLGQYRFYQMNFLDDAKMRTFKHADQLGKGQVFFGVNFQPSDQVLNRQIKKNVQGTFLDFHGDFDMMSYLDSDVPGCSLPQMYFKTPGCWTGGHQQNICMSALNINHGPDYSQWFTLQLKYVQELRSQLLETYNTDLYSSQGLWYERLDWFISRGYPVKRFLQRKDDIVVTGPGTLHWVRSFGVAIQTSWNIFPKNYQQFQAAFLRHKVNQQIKFHKSDTIPLKSLILKYLNHERSTMPNNNLEICSNKMRQWLLYQQEFLSLIQNENKITKRSYYYLRDLQSFCCLCRQEVLIYFLPAPAQKERGISCLQCFYKNKKTKGNSIIDDLYFKRHVYWVQMLLDICSNEKLNTNNPAQIIQLCKGEHVGCLPVQCRMKKSFMDQKMIKEILVMDQKQQINNAQREIFYNNDYLFQLYQKYFSNVSQIKAQIQSRHGKNLDRPKPILVKASKMMTMLQEGQMVEEKQQQRTILVHSQCQTIQSRLNQQQKQQGQISKSRSRSKQKKKKKQKHKKKKDKKQKQQIAKKQQSPRFKSQSQQQHKIRQSPNPSPPRGDYNNNNNYNYNNNNNNRPNYGDNQDDNYQGNRNWGNRNNNFQNRNRGDNWGNRERYNDRNDRNDRGNRNWNNNNNNNFDNNEDNQGQMGRKRNFNDYNRQNSFDDGGRGRGRGRGRGGRGRGRGGGFRDNNNNNFESRNNDGFNNNNQENENKSQDNFNTNNQNQQEAPDEY